MTRADSCRHLPVIVALPKVPRVRPLVLVLGMGLTLWVLWDAFETILLPRRVPSRLRPSRFVLRWLWRPWARFSALIAKRSRREGFLAYYALLAIVTLVIVWALGLVVGFAMVHWGAGSRMSGVGMAEFSADLYMSGTTFFTLGLGDLHPTSTVARIVTVVEAGTGFGFLAMVIAYVPVFYTAFSRREARITMLDEWAGSPPSAAVLLRRCMESRDPNALSPLLKDWETTCAEILESHLSYPILCYFRSQHDNQSWLGSLVAVLDTCALVLVGVERIDPFQARLTFAIARHTLVDLCQTLALRPRTEGAARIASEDLATLRRWLQDAGVNLKTGPEADRRLEELTGLYLPYARPLADLLLMPLPSMLPPAKARYNWETTAWATTAPDDAH
jgi:hypothetical protein